MNKAVDTFRKLLDLGLLFLFFFKKPEPVNIKRGSPPVIEKSNHLQVEKQEPEASPNFSSNGVKLRQKRGKFGTIYVLSLLTSTTMVVKIVSNLGK